MVPQLGHLILVFPNAPKTGTRGYRVQCFELACYFVNLSAIILELVLRYPVSPAEDTTDPERVRVIHYTISSCRSGW